MLEGSAPTRRIALSILAVFTAINFVNYLDRYVLFAVLEPMSKELGLLDSESGFLGTAFILVYALASPWLGQLGDRVSRKKITAISVVLWSLATMGSGMAEDYATLFTMRALVGVGEAGYAAVAPAVISDLFRPQERGRKLAYFYLATPMGSALGFLVGGAMADAHGWRMAFYVAGVPGLIMAAIVLLLPEPQRGALDEEPLPTTDVPLMSTVRRLFRSPAWRINTVGMTLMTFTVGGLGAWMPTYLARAHDLSTGEAGTGFGAVTVLGGLIGTLVGGWLGDRAQAKGAGGYFRVSGYGLLLGAPFALLMTAQGDATSTLIVAFGAELLLFLNTGPLNAALMASVPATMRARAMAVNVFIIHVLGDAISPPLMGAVSDARGPALAIELTAIPVALGGLALIWGARRMDREPQGLRAVDGDEPESSG
ncbi:MAG: MFS transporter [Myxococcota bacterium]